MVLVRPREKIIRHGSAEGMPNRGLRSTSALRRRVARSIARRIIGSGIAAAIAGAIIFAGLWMTSEFPLGPSDRVLELFSSAPPVSIEALKGGAIVAALFSFFVGAISAALYELLHR